MGILIIHGLQITPWKGTRLHTVLRMYEALVGVQYSTFEKAKTSSSTKEYIVTVKTNRDGWL